MSFEIVLCRRDNKGDKLDGAKQSCAGTAEEISDFYDKVTCKQAPRRVKGRGKKGVVVLS